MTLSNTPDMIYLVDLENIGTRTLYKHIGSHPGAWYFVFYSDSTPGPGQMLENIPVMVQVSFVDCKSGSNNAMDFCISAMAGKLSADIRKPMMILSDDKGYDPMLLLLNRQGIRIGRESTGHQASCDGNQEKAPMAQDMSPLVRAVRANVPKQYQDDLVASLTDGMCRSDMHEACQRILPEKMVSDIYKKLKKHIPKE